MVKSKLVALAVLVAIIYLPKTGDCLMLSRVKQVLAREVLDSRGFPTIEVDVITEGGDKGRASVPSGVSTGKYEAHELRDGDASRYMGKGVLRAVKNVRELISPRLIGCDTLHQYDIDNLLLELDGSANKSTLGANAILAVSIACAKAAAACCRLPLYRYLGGAMANRLPMPMVNILNGGAHASNKLSFQEFMIVPLGASVFSECLRISSEVFQSLKLLLKEKNYGTAVGDEGGFSPDLEDEQEALQLIVAATERAGYEPGKDLALALDVAASEFYHAGKYKLNEHTLDGKQMVEYLGSLCEKYPIVSVEDGLHEEDWSAFAALTARVGDKVRVVGDDLFVTNKKRLLIGKEKSAANAILIKPNQIGTLSETMSTVFAAQNIGYHAIISHRSGETEDTSIADLAVATGVGAIKTGSMSRTDRLCKYNQLLRIEEELGSAAVCRWE